jgi:hypothetical protein
MNIKTGRRMHIPKGIHKISVPFHGSRDSSGAVAARLGTG